jgi:hypothetical protein
MAKQLQRTYVFTPGTSLNGTVQLPGRFDLSQILIITNVTKNVIIYSFADPSFIGTTVSFSRVNNANFPQTLQNSDGITTINLAYDTSTQSSADILQIFCERGDGATITRPWAMGTDAFERTRVASPQSMLDADFEYGLQPTKWQTNSLVRGYPGIYEIPGTDINPTSVISDASGGGIQAAIESLITITTPNPHGITTGSAITVQNLDPTASGALRAQGSFIVNNVTGSNVLTYYAKAQVTTVTNTTIGSGYTIVRKGGFYTGAAIGTTTFATAGSGAGSAGTVTVTFAQNHGMIPGQGIVVVVTSDNGSNNHTLCQGPFYILSTPSPTTITYTARNVGTITGTPSGSVYARSDSFYQHRPFDGGVSLGAGGPNYGSQAVRMSKKYIRYQSGKAVNYNTAALFAPNYNLKTITSNGLGIGSTITVTTDDLDHGLQAGATVGLNNIQTTGYNGTYSVSTVIDERSFVVTATSVLGATTAIFGTPAYLNHVNWHGAVVRAGTFDEQNGVYWQYDGQLISVGLRSSTFQCAGTVNVSTGSNLITGINTLFNTQLYAGDRVIIRGMTHVVTAITSATWMYVAPDYRGVSNATGVKMVRTQDILIPQNQWNVDRCDGTSNAFNPSGYSFTPSKLQMIGLQWTWYGAGFIDWMLRGPNGDYMTVHRMKNSNINTEAYMRSGNQPVRYEVINEGAKSFITTDLSSVGAVMTVSDVTFFPPNGTIYVDNELIGYTGKSASTGTAQLTGLSRSVALTPYVAGSVRSFTAGSASAHSAGTGIVLSSQNATPTISHWGSAFMTDGGFDQDRGYIFNYQTTNINVSTRKTAVFAIRLAPSVSNAIIGDLGTRDLINRAQLLLQAIEITAAGSTSTNQAIVVEGVINPSNYPNTVTNITWYGLAGGVAGGNIYGSGQPSFTQIAPSTAINFDGTATYTTTVTSSGASTGATLIPVNSTASIAIGDAVTIPGNTIAGNTLVQSIGNATITVTQPVLQPLVNGNTLVFYRNTWAVPGETIFSFISSPANKDSLDLSSLKELTNTPLGGQGTYPNGPDTLFINVYLTQGNAIPVNLVLRWGEAQA